jgi:hypothetical protein
MFGLFFIGIFIVSEQISEHNVIKGRLVIQNWFFVLAGKIVGKK